MASTRRWRTRRPRRSAISFACGRMLADLPDALQRAAPPPMPRPPRPRLPPRACPSYYAQDFHFQTGGYLSEDSARLYDIQVETLFMGAAGPMRRAALRPIAEFMARPRPAPRHAASMSPAAPGASCARCGLPIRRMRLQGLDLSRTYLDEARRQPRRPARRRADRGGGGEDAARRCQRRHRHRRSSSIHELPPDVRRQVTAEIAARPEAGRPLRVPRQPADGRPVPAGTACSRRSRIASTSPTTAATPSTNS